MVDCGVNGTLPDAGRVNAAVVPDSRDANEEQSSRTGGIVHKDASVKDARVDNASVAGRENKPPPVQHVL